MERNTTCCFTGHRPSKLPWGTNETDSRCVLLKERLYDTAEAVYKSGVTHFICGMAQGCDMYFCEQIILLRNTYDDITLEAAIPCEEQAWRWREEERTRYCRLIVQCDFETLLQRNYTSKCMTQRNKYMVDNSAVLIAVFDGKLGGTMHTIRYALKKKLEVIEIRP